MSNKKYIDFPTGSLSDSGIGLVADPSTGQLYKVSQKQAKDYYTAGVSGSGTGSLTGFSGSVVYFAPGGTPAYTPAFAFNSTNNSLYVSGSITTNNIKIASGSANGYVLTSDVNGNGSWAPSQGGGVSGSGFVTTSSFNTFSSSYVSDSASFNNRINNITASVSGSGFVTTSSFNSFSSSYHVDSGSFNSRILSLSGSGNTSFPKASDLGVTITGDQTSLLNTIFANSSYDGLIFDFVGGGSVTISGSLNANGKVMRFLSGNYITSTAGATISSAVIDAGMRQKIFDIAVSLSSCLTLGTKFSALWYGYVINSGDTTYSLQKSIDTIIANPSLRTLFFPAGTYFINQPLVVYNWNGTNYSQCSIALEGESPFWQKSGTGTTIRTNGFKDSFALGIQMGKGVEVKNISFLGGFTPPTLTSYQFFTCPFASYTDGVSRDSTNSPYAGIVIDPFCTSVPADGGYPNIVSYNTTGSSFYRANGGGGSTGIVLEDIVINNFVVGFITSPNGVTSNAELIHINKIQINNVKVAICGTQEQEKLNKVEHLACWNNVHTVFLLGASGGYGRVTPGHWIIDGVNIAGNVNRLINRNGAGYFPCVIKNVYAESLGTIGTWGDTQGASLEDSLFDFVNLNVFGAYPNYPSDSYFNNTGVTVKNCSFRHYDGTNTPLIFNGGYYYNCSFDAYPYGINLVNCTVGGVPVNPPNDEVVFRSGASRFFAGGKVKFLDKTEYQQGKNVSMIPRDYNNTAFLELTNLQNYQTSSYTVTSNSMTVTPPSSSDLGRVILNKLAFDLDSSQFLGITTAVGASTYTISYVPDGVTSGGSKIGLYCAMPIFSFMGTTTAGSTSITDVTIDFGNYTDFINYGGGFIKIPNFYGFRTWGAGAKIISYTASTRTIVMDRPAFTSSVNYYYASNYMGKDIDVFSYNNTSFFAGSGLQNTEIIPKGTRIRTNIPPSGSNEYIAISSGFLGSGSVANLKEITV